MTKPKRVLVFVEFESIRKIITRQLESSRFEVVAVTDVSGALKELNGTGFDLFIADNDIGNDSAIRIIKHMRGTTSYLFTPIILLVTGNKERYMEQLGEYNIAMYLPKPFDVKLLSNVLVRVAR